MKHTTKLMVVPFVNVTAAAIDPQEKYLNDLDAQMQNILEKKDISAKEKLTLYNELLGRYLSKNKDNQIRIKQATTKPKIKKEPKIKFEPYFYDSDLSPKQDSKKAKYILNSDIKESYLLSNDALEQLKNNNFSK